MKKCVKVLLFLTLLFSLSFNVMAGGDEEMPEPDATETELVEAGFPIVTGIYDAAEEGPIVTQIATDQMGKYISVYVRGKNINKDTVKPVFYDSEGNVISGEVKAVEVSSDRNYGGAFFRIEKNGSSAWNIDNTAACDTKNYTVKLESLCGKAILDGNNNYAEYGDKAATVTIYRRDVFYTSFNEYDETLTLYFSSDIDLKKVEKLELGWFDYDSENNEYVMNVVKTVKDFEIIVRENKFTGHNEQMARCSLKGFDYNNAFENWTPMFRVTFTNGKTNETEVYDTSYPSDNINQILGRTSFFQSAYQSGKVSGGYDVILYYPYWIGGVYKFADTGNDYDYFLTKDEVEYLKDERFSYARYTKGKGRLDTGSFNDDRRYQFVYFVQADKPKKPNGVPTVKVSVEGEDYDKYVTLSWNKISDVTGYKVYLVSENGSKYCVTETKETTYSFPAAIAMELGFENPKVQVCAYIEKGGMVVEGDLSKALPLENSLSAPAKVTISKASYIYDGKAKKPTVTVKDENGDKIAKGNYTVKYTNNVKVGKAKVAVTFKGKYKSFKKMSRTFKINPKSTSISSLTALNNGFKIKWKAQKTQTTGYQIRYSKSSSFKSYTTKTVSTKYTSKSYTGLSDKKTYYVKIRTYKTVDGTKYYSAWSAAKKVKTK